MFNFAIIGAGNIAEKFAHAISLIQDSRVLAVASKTFNKASEFAHKWNIPLIYDDYCSMVDAVHPDAVYIATMPSTHAELTEMCLQRHIPVLCEKAMFMNSSEAKRVLDLSKKTNTFAMEGMWSRFLPAQKQAKGWISAGSIGAPCTLQITIGTIYNPETNANLLQEAHGGGAAHHLTVYGHELATYYFGTDIMKTIVTARINEFQTDCINNVTLHYQDKTASIFTSCCSAVEERLVIAGTKGRIILENPHFASEAYLYNKSGELMEHFKDTESTNGFVYEIQEVIECIRGGKIESNIMPHLDTILCSEMFDMIADRSNVF